MPRCRYTTKPTPHLSNETHFQPAQVDTDKNGRIFVDSALQGVVVIAVSLNEEHRAKVVDRKRLNLISFLKAQYHRNSGMLGARTPTNKWNGVTGSGPKSTH